MKALLGETLLITKRSCKAREFGKMITNKMHVQKNIIFSDGRVWISLSELVKIEQKLDQHPVKFISRNSRHFVSHCIYDYLMVESGHGVRARQIIFHDVLAISYTHL